MPTLRVLADLNLLNGAVNQYEPQSLVGSLIIVISALAIRFTGFLAIDPFFY